MDFKENIIQKSDELIRKAKTLPDISIRWEKPVVVKCAELTAENNLAEAIRAFDNHKEKPGIYYFQITSNHSGGEIINALRAYKQLNQRACPKIDNSRPPDSTCLYCGSIRKNLKDRFKQHAGFGHPKTYGLQLAHWAADIKLELEFHYSWLDKAYEEYTELIESAMADKVKPLVGKLAV